MLLRPLRPCGTLNLVSNDEVERRGGALPTNEADLSQPSIHPLAHRRRDPAIARTVITDEKHPT
jgi:hypothetical protein